MLREMFSFDLTYYLKICDRFLDSTEVCRVTYRQDLSDVGQQKGLVLELSCLRGTTKPQYTVKKAKRKLTWLRWSDEAVNFPLACASCMVMTIEHCSHCSARGRVCPYTHVVPAGVSPSVCSITDWEGGGCN